MAPAPQPFIWYDVMAPDMRVAEQFYAAALGWRAADAGVAGMEYAILFSGEQPVGGIMPAPPGFVLPPMWTGYIHSPDVDGDTRRAAEAGGTVFQDPLDIPGVGRFAVIADPGGALFSIFQPAGGAPMAQASFTAASHVGWHDLRAGDGEAAWEFYSKLFGWVTTETMEAMPGVPYRMFVTGGEQAGGMMTMRPGATAAHWTFFFNTDAIDAAAARIEKAGGTVTLAPMEVPGGQWIIEAKDPHGAGFGLLADRR